MCSRLVSIVALLLLLKTQNFSNQYFKSKPLHCVNNLHTGYFFFNTFSVLSSGRIISWLRVCEAVVCLSVLRSQNFASHDLQQRLHFNISDSHRRWFVSGWKKVKKTVPSSGFLDFLNFKIYYKFRRFSMIT